MFAESTLVPSKKSMLPILIGQFEKDHEKDDPQSKENAFKKISGFLNDVITYSTKHPDEKEFPIDSFKRISGETIDSLTRYQIIASTLKKLAILKEKFPKDIENAFLITYRKYKTFEYLDAAAPVSEEVSVQDLDIDQLQSEILEFLINDIVVDGREQYSKFREKHENFDFTGIDAKLFYWEGDLYTLILEYLNFIHGLQEWLDAYLADAKDRVNFLLVKEMKYLINYYQTCVNSLGVIVKKNRENDNILSEGKIAVNATFETEKEVFHEIQCQANKIFLKNLLQYITTFDLKDTLLKNASTATPKEILEQCEIHKSKVGVQAHKHICYIKQRIMQYYGTEIPSTNDLLNPRLYLGENARISNNEQDIFAFSEKTLLENFTSTANTEIKKINEYRQNILRSSSRSIVNKLRGRSTHVDNNRECLVNKLTLAVNNLSASVATGNGLSKIVTLFQSYNQALYGDLPLKGPSDFKSATERNIKKLLNVLNENNDKLNCLLNVPGIKISKQDIYYESHHFINKHIEEYAIGAFSERVEKIYNRLPNLLIDNAMKEQRKADFENLMKKLVACKKESDYIDFLWEARKKVKEAGNFFWDKLYQKTITKVCLIVIEEHMLGRENFQLDFNVAQLEYARAIIGELETNPRKKTCQNVMAGLEQQKLLKTQNSIKMQLSEFDEASYQHAIENGTLIKNQRAQETRVQHKIKTFTSTILKKAVNNWLADKVISTDRFMLLGKDVSMIGMALSMTFGWLKLPGAGVVSGLANFADRKLQVAGSAQTDDNVQAFLETLVTDYGSFACWEKLIQQVVNTLSEIFHDQIAEMSGDSVEKFGAFCYKRIYAEILSPTKYDNDDELSFHDRLVLAVFNQQEKLTLIPFKKDTYAVEGGVKKRMTLQGLVNNLAFATEDSLLLDSQQKLTQIKLHVTRSSLGYVDEADPSLKNTKIMRNPKTYKYGVSLSSFFAKNSSLLGKINRIALTLKKGEDSDQRSGTLDGGENVNVSLNLEVPVKGRKQSQGKHLWKAAKNTINAVRSKFSFSKA